MLFLGFIVTEITWKSVVAWTRSLNLVPKKSLPICMVVSATHRAHKLRDEVRSTLVHGLIEVILTWARNRSLAYLVNNK